MALGLGLHIVKAGPVPMDIAPPIAGPGIAAVSRFRTKTGIRRTSLADTLSVDVEAFTNLEDAPDGEGGIARVVFSVVVNGGAATVINVSNPSLRFPNYSDQDSPLPGVTSGMAPLWCYGTTLSCWALAAGTIVVTAAVVSRGGTTTAVPGSVTLYNDSDGVDRRPSTKRIFVSPTGNDANPGTELLPMQTLANAIPAARANPAGSTSAHFDCGGAEVVMMPGAHLWAGGHYGAASWHTSGAWWVTVTFQDGATITRTIDGSGAAVYPDAYLIATGYAGGSTARIRLVNAQFVGQGGVVYAATDTEVHVWVDGGTSGSAYWDEVTTPWSVRFREDDAQVIGFDGPEIASAKRYASCHHRRGFVFGFAGWTDLHDVRMSDWLGIALQSSGDENGNAVCNALIERQRYTTADVAGYVDLTGGAQFDVTIPVAGQMRIDALSALSMNIATQLVELEGTTFWGAHCTGFTSAGNNGLFLVLDTGTNLSGFPYVILNNGSAVDEVGGVGARVYTARLVRNVSGAVVASATGTTLTIAGTPWSVNAYAGLTARAISAAGVQQTRTISSNTNNTLTVTPAWTTTPDATYTFEIGSSEPYTTVVHTDLHQWNSARTETMHTNIAIRDVPQAQSWFTSGHNMTRCVLFNVSDGGQNLVANFVDSTFLDCLFLNCTFAGLWDWSAAPETFSGLNVVNCVMGNSGLFPGSAAFISHNHFIAGSTYGTSPTSGLWFLGDPSLTPWSLEPLEAQKGTGSGALRQAPDWRWNVSATRGAWRNVALCDWTVPVQVEE